MLSINRNQGFVTPNIDTYNIKREKILLNKNNNLTIYILMLIIISFIACYLYKNQTILSVISDIIKRMSNSNNSMNNSNYVTIVAKKHANNMLSILNQNKNKIIF